MKDGRSCPELANLRLRCLNARRVSDEILRINIKKNEFKKIKITSANDEAFGDFVETFDTIGHLPDKTVFR